VSAIPNLSKFETKIGGATVTGQNLLFFALLNPQELLQPAPRRGESILIPGKPGRLARPTVADELEVDLQFFVSGTPISVAGGYEATGALQIAKDLLSTVLFAAGDANGTLPFSVYAPFAANNEGQFFVGRLQTLSLEFGEGLYECSAVAGVRIPVPAVRAVSSSGPDPSSLVVEDDDDEQGS
jgi:hypothetical protein